MTTSYTCRLLALVGLVALALPAFSQSTFYAGHAGNGNGESNPGAFSAFTPATGAVAVIGTANASGGGVAGLASNGSTIYAALAQSGAATLVTINPLTGTVASTIGPVTLGGNACAIGDLAMGASGILYGITANGSNHVCDGNSAGTIVEISTTTGVATALGRPMQDLFSSSNVNGGLAVDGAGNLWLSPGWNHPDPGNLYTLNLGTGLVDTTLALSGTFPNDEGANGLMWNPDDGLLYASFEQDAPGNTSVWQINPTTGASVLVTNSTAQVHDMVAVSGTPGAGGVTEIPVLPLWMMGLMTAALGFIGLRGIRQR